MCGRAAVNVPPSPSSMHHPKFRTLEFLNPKHSWMTLGPGNPLWKYAFYKELPDTTDQYFKSICCFRHPPRKIGLSFSKVQSSAGREKTNQPNPPQPNNKQMQKNPKWSPRETKSLDGTASDTQNNLCSFYNLTLILQQLKLYMLQSNKLLDFMSSGLYGFLSDCERFLCTQPLVIHLKDWGPRVCQVNSNEEMPHRKIKDTTTGTAASPAVSLLSS